MIPASSSSSTMYFEMQKPDFFSYRLSSVPNGCGIRTLPESASLNSATEGIGRWSRSYGARRNSGTSSSVCQVRGQKALGTSKK